MKELLIVGAGPVGLYAAFTAGLRKIDAVVVESAQTVGGQLNLYLEKTIYDIPAFKSIKASELINALYEQFKPYEKDIPLHLNETIETIEKEDGYFVVKTNKETYEVKKILMTHGGGKFLPRKIEGLEATNVAYNVLSLDQYKDKKVAIFGGGDSALDWANLIKEIATDVYLIHRRPEFRAHLSSVDTFQEKGGNIYAPYQLKSHIQEDDLVEEIVIENKETNEEASLKVDEILVFFGLIQTRASYETWLVDAENGLIIVDSKMNTSVEGIYACGNGVTYTGKQKMITSGFGEVITALGAINHELHPEQRVTQYSSMLKK